MTAGILNWYKDISSCQKDQKEVRSRLIKNGALSDLRVIDLADEKGMLCGRILGDLGADVIKIEKPGGDRARRIGPFYHDVPDPNKSLYWFAFNTNKRGITLDIESERGKEIFRKLAESADVVIESFQPGYLDSLGLGYAALGKINPKVILTSITGFGQEGPYRSYKSADIVAWAMGGLMNQTGDSDRPPLQVSLPQSFIAASTYAAEGTLVAIYGRDLTKSGQHVDVSAIETLAWVGSESFPFWYALGQNRSRSGSRILRTGGILSPQIFKSRDSYVSYLIQVGRPGAERNTRMSKWLDEEGLATEFIRTTDWYQLDWLDFVSSPGGLERLTGPLSKLFLRYTSKELFDEALKRNISLYPVASSRDTVENEQLADRKFWVDLDHPELNERIKYPGPFAVLTGTPIQIRRRAPLIGEHNIEVYAEAGISEPQIAELKQAGVI